MISKKEEEDKMPQRSSGNDDFSKKKMKNKSTSFKGDKTKRLLIGAGGRILFYPTVLYNLVRFKLQSQFRWWDQINEFLLMGAVPFRKDVRRLKRLGVGGVITLNEPFETFVPSSLYKAYEMEHLVIPTRDYLFAPTIADIAQAVNFIHKNALLGKITYVHCKAGRGRSTTVVLCYLIEHKSMTAAAAFEHVRAIRPRVLLHPSQRKVVDEYYSLRFPSNESIFIATSDVV